MYNQVNSTLHMVTELNPDALRIARTLDAERANGTVYGPLHGIPILIKNNIATMDKMNNTAGSYALLGAKVPRDSGVAAKLRKAGAIILGKTNLSQWANFRSYNTSNGWSAYGTLSFWSSRILDLTGNPFRRTDIRSLLPSPGPLGLFLWQWRCQLARARPRMPGDRNGWLNPLPI
jgi:Asp-tRNA(Asn)/Glu-tRNA(Gln) amidotransferase A subunit family amidase